MSMEPSKLKNSVDDNIQVRVSMNPCWIPISSPISIWKERIKHLPVTEARTIRDWKLKRRETVAGSFLKIVPNKFSKRVRRLMVRQADISRSPQIRMNLPKFIKEVLYRQWNGLLLFLIATLRRFQNVLHSIKLSLPYFVLISAVLSVLTQSPNLCNAASICMPVPTLQGIGHICVDIGNRPEAYTEPKQDPKPEIPSIVNPQRIPCGSEGNIFTRAGLRPHTLVRDTCARIKAAAQQRLEVMRSMDSWSEEQRQSAFSRNPRAMNDPFCDPFEDVYGVANIPRSQILADTIDPFDLTLKGVFLAVLFRRFASAFFTISRGHVTLCIHMGSSVHL